MSARAVRLILVGAAVLGMAATTWSLGGCSAGQARSVAVRLGLATATTEAEEALEVSGTIEAEEVFVVPEIGGRVLEVLVEEGQRVEAGQALVRLDESVLLAQQGQALATLEAARANLEAVSAGPQETVVRRAEAALAQARAQHEGALSAWWNARAIRNNPQDLDARIDEARTQVALAREELDAARARLKAAEIVRDRYQNDGSLEGKERYRIESERVQAAQAQVEATEKRLEAAQATLRLLLQVRQNPVALEVQVKAAEAQARVARAGVRVAEAGLALAKAGPRPEEVEMAAAQVEQAEAAVDLVKVQLAKQTLRAPVDGVVSRLLVREGEVALPGSTVCILADLDVVELVVYVPEARIGWVRVGQEAEVTVDSFPGRVFLGKVSYISQEAEFTPRNVQTTEERAKTVFAVKVRIPNPDGSLKAGMPADAVIRVR